MEWTIRTPRSAGRMAVPKHVSGGSRAARATRIAAADAWTYDNEEQAQAMVRRLWPLAPARRSATSGGRGRAVGPGPNRGSDRPAVHRSPPGTRRPTPQPRVVRTRVLRADLPDRSRRLIVNREAARTIGSASGPLTSSATRSDAEGCMRATRTVATPAL